MAQFAIVRFGGNPQSESNSLDSSLTPFSSPSPLLQLPPEILSSIFAYTCHADFPKPFSRNSKRRRTTPFTLGCVCRRWRYIVQCTPYVWSHIFLSLNASRYPNQMDLFEEYLSRSGACLLTMNLTFDDEEPWSRSTHQPTRLIGLLVSSAKRWKVIDFILPEGWFSHLEGITNDLVALTTVSIRSLRSDFRRSPSRPKRYQLTLFSSTPLLRSLNLNGYYLTDVDAPWSQLTCLALKRVYLDECFYAFLQTPHLTDCRILNILFNNAAREVVKTDLTLSLLQNLEITDAHPDDMGVILDCLLAPFIEALEISSPRIPLDLGSFARLISKTGCGNKLRVLKLQRDFTFFGSEDELLGFLDTFPNLEDLRISLPFKDDQPLWKFFIKLLAEQDRGEDRRHGGDASNFGDETYNRATYRFLKLERFSLKGNIVPPPKPDRTLVDAIAHRWEGQCRENTSGLPFIRLRYFDLTGNSTNLERQDYRDHLDFFRSDFARLREKGMHIRMKLNPKRPSV